MGGGARRWNHDATSAREFARDVVENLPIKSKIDSFKGDNVSRYLDDVGRAPSTPRPLSKGAMLGLAGLLAMIVSALLGGCAVTPTAPEEEGAEIGFASYYADRLQGRRTASGERYDRQAFTAAHRRLAFGTRVKVMRLDNGRSVTVRINDRGPFVKGRVIDLSRAAAEALGMLRAGVVKVRIMPED